MTTRTAKILADRKAVADMFRTSTLELIAIYNKLIAEGTAAGNDVVRLTEMRDNLVAFGHV